MRPTQSTPVQDAIALYAHRNPGRTMAQVARRVCPGRSHRDARAAIRRAERNGRVELRPNPRHRGSFLVYPGSVPGAAETADLAGVDARRMRVFRGRLQFTRAEKTRLESLFRREAKAIRAYYRGRTGAKARREVIRARQNEIINVAERRGPSPEFEARRQRIVEAMARRLAANAQTARGRERRPRRPAVRKSPLELR